MASIGEENGVRIQSSSVHYNMDYSLQNPVIPPQGKTRISDPSSGGSKARPRTLQVTSYHECLKNHAANTGGNVTDGCGEFMPSGEEGTLEALKCAACSCHRNFHRKYNHGERTTSALMRPLFLPTPLPSPSMFQHLGGGVTHWTSMVQPLKVAFKGVGGDGSIGTDTSSEELNFNSFMAPASLHSAKKKGQRTKFTAEQKEKMLGFAEKLGWRIPREDDTEVRQFCGEVGVRRHVFKVWMHNNKISSKKTSQLVDE
ncbi:zinc-finger homeodomain protein 2-like [Primulina eburnea]|uniref:zinc-finger homeodomain protein 2-like n=1 Tax=Primulina eburnea TaxID=1245227 RepID=UPI003C6C1A2C